MVGNPLRSAKRRKVNINDSDESISAPGILGRFAAAIASRSYRTTSPDPLDGSYDFMQDGNSTSKPFLNGHAESNNYEEAQSPGLDNSADQPLSMQEHQKDVVSVRTTLSRQQGKQTRQTNVQPTPYNLDGNGSFKERKTPMKANGDNIDLHSYSQSRDGVATGLLGFEVQSLGSDGKSALCNNDVHEEAPQEDIEDTITVIPNSSDSCRKREGHESPLIRSSGRQRKPSRKHRLELETAVLSKATPPNVLARKRSSDGKAEDQHSPVPKPSRKRGRPRKDAKTAPETPVGEGNGSGLEGLPRKVRPDIPSVQEPRETNDIRMRPVELDPDTPKRKRGRPTTVNVLPNGPELIPEIDIKQPPNDHLAQLQALLGKERSAESFALLKAQIVDGLTGKRRLPLVGLDEEYQKVHQLVEQTVLAGEGNSMLIIGARGSGKTTMVETIISEMATIHRDDFHVIRLNGFIHTDDKLALKEIWRQLGREMELDDDEVMGSRSNHADTLASLLALLSHTSVELDSSEQEAHAAKSVVFIMDEFDLFTSHPRQTLLYNLFDIAQSRKAPIAVLGLTTKIDVVESLEKRVKSRFSHRYVHTSLPRSFRAFLDICMSALCCKSPNDLTSISRPTYNPSEHGLDDEPFVHAWSNYMTAVLAEDPMMTSFLGRIYAHGNSVPTFLTSCLIPVLSMTPDNLPTALDFMSNALLPPDSKLNLLTGLSELELSLLIAAARLDVILDTDTCNFNMAYDEYTMLTDRVRLQSSSSGAAAVGAGGKVWGREVALGCWERLEELELLVPVYGIGGASGAAGCGRAGKLLKVDVGLEEIGASGLEMSSVMTRWCRQI